MNFISIDDVSSEQMHRIFYIADRIKAGKMEVSVGQDAIMVLLFEKPSTRTRVSFEAAMAKLGGKSIYLDSTTTQLSRGESLSDTAKVLSGYANYLVARMNRHSDIVELASSSTIPVINALTDLEHPCQSLSDLYTVRDAKKALKGIRLAFVGDIAANTANSLMLAGVKLGVDIVLIGPKEYQPNPVYFTKAREYGSVEVFDDPKEGLSDVDVIYTDTFVSMGQEKEAQDRKKLFGPYQVNAEMLKDANDDASVMHCLPAHRGEEISAEGLDGPRSVVWDQAKNKMLIEEAILLYLSENETG